MKIFPAPFWKKNCTLNLFTVGFGNNPIAPFISLLQNAGIDTIIEVRSSHIAN